MWVQITSGYEFMMQSQKALIQFFQYFKKIYVSKMDQNAHRWQNVLCTSGLM